MSYDKVLVGVIINAFRQRITKTTSLLGKIEQIEIKEYPQDYDSEAKSAIEDFLSTYSTDQTLIKLVKLAGDTLALLTDDERSCCGGKYSSYVLVPSGEFQRFRYQEMGATRKEKTNPKEAAKWYFDSVKSHKPTIPQLKASMEAELDKNVLNYVATCIRKLP